MREFWAHSYNPAGEPHQLKAHLKSVGQLAKEFAGTACQEMAEAAEWAGLLHDLGKYRDEFQEYLRAEREGGVETHHAIYGAALLFRLKRLGPTLAIAGHHAGLHDWHQLAEELKADTKYAAKAQLPLLLERFERELGRIAEEIREPDFTRNDKVSAEFYVRMLFSALVDADFLDTEAHLPDGAALHSATPAGRTAAAADSGKRGEGV